MQTQDLDWVLRVEQQVYDFPWSESGFESSLDRGLNYIFCSAEGEDLGYVCILPVVDEAHLLNLCISPQFQNKGVGKAAIQALKEKLGSSGYALLLLEVRESNLAAQALYGRCGFSRDGVRKNYYRCRLWDEALADLVEGREDAILMSCTL
jgi:ribosomal-protein-alanine N-acetyltransferase